MVSEKCLGRIISKQGHSLGVANIEASEQDYDRPTHMINLQPDLHGKHCTRCFTTDPTLLKCRNPNCTFYFCEECDGDEAHPTHGEERPPSTTELRKRMVLPDAKSVPTVVVFVALRNLTESDDTLKSVEGAALLFANQLGFPRLNIMLCFTIERLKSLDRCDALLTICHTLPNGHLSLRGTELTVAEWIEVVASLPLELPPKVW